MFISLMIFWGLLSTRELISIIIIAAFSFLITFVGYIRTYQTVRRHKNHIQSMQIRDEAQSEEIKNLIVLIKSTVGIFYVYLVFFYLLFALSHLHGCYSIDPHVSKFIFEPCHLLLEDETRSTRYHGHTSKDVLEQQSAISGKLQSVIECRPY